MVNNLTPAGITFSPGIVERLQKTRDRRGIIVNADQFPAEEDPQVTLEFGVGFQPEIAQWQIGSQFTEQTTTPLVTEELLIPSAPGPYTFAAVTTGQLGFGTVDDADAKAGYKSETTDLSNNITRNPVATGITGTFEFTFGANRALTFSADLADESIVLQYPLPSGTYVKSSEIPSGIYEINAMIIMKDLSVYGFRMFRCRPILDGAEIDFTGETTSITFRLFSPPGACRAYELVRLGQAISC